MANKQRVVGLVGIMLVGGAFTAAADQSGVCKPGGTPNPSYHCVTTTSSTTTTSTTTTTVRSTSTSRTTTTRIAPPPPPTRTTAPPNATTPGIAPPGDVPFTG